MVFTNQYLLRTVKKLTNCLLEKEGKQLILSNGNETNDEMTYAIVAFKDWKQVEIFNNRKVVYTKVAPETRQIFNFTLPSVDRKVICNSSLFHFLIKLAKKIISVNKHSVPFAS